MRRRCGAGYHQNRDGIATHYILQPLPGAWCRCWVSVGLHTSSVNRSSYPLGPCGLYPGWLSETTFKWLHPPLERSHWQTSSTLQSLYKGCWSVTSISIATWALPTAHRRGWQHGHTTARFHLQQTRVYQWTSATSQIVQHVFSQETEQ